MNATTALPRIDDLFSLAYARARLGTQPATPMGATMQSLIYAAPNGKALRDVPAPQPPRSC